MNRSPLMDRLGLRGKAKSKHYVAYAPLGIEPLEERRLLSASDILVSTAGGDSSGESVERYNDATQLPVPGGVATGDHGLTSPSGVAVAADGSYYVSNPATNQVLHYGNSGVFLDALGASDAIPADLVSPGALAFGPNGNLYVADTGADKIFQFDISSPTQQYLSSATLSLAFTPGGIAFASGSTNDLIVGDITDQSVQSYDGAAWATLVSDVNPLALLSEADGALLIADAGGESGHDQILAYNSAPTPTTTQIISFTTPLGTGALAPQPTSLLLDADGSLLVGLSSDGVNNGAVEEFDIQTTPAVLIGAVASGISNPSGLALAPSGTSDLLVGNYGDGVLRYGSNGQSLSTGDSDPGSADPPASYGLAVAPDGSYYVSNSGPGGTDQVLHYSSSGTFLNVLDDGDSSGPTLYAPGTLSFGPDGNLYVADLGASAIYQYNTSLSTSQQFVSTGTISLPAIELGGNSIQFVPAGFTFSNDATRDPIVGDFDTGEVLQCNADGSFTTLIAAGTPGPDDSGNPLCPIAMQELSDGNLLIADTDPGGDGGDHHQVVQYDASTQTLSQFIDLTEPVDAEGDAPQPSALLLTPDGNLLVGVSPDDDTSPSGAVEEFSLADQQLISTEVSSLGILVGLALAPPNVMSADAADWTSAGLTVAAGVDGDLHVYQTGTTTDAVAPQPADGAGQIGIVGADDAANTLTVDFTGGSPIPADGLVFNGGSGTAVNSLVISGSSELSGTMQIAGSVMLGQAAADSFSLESGAIDAALSGPGELCKTGSGAVTLSGSNSYLGGTSVAGGALIVTAPAALPPGTSLTVAAGGTFIFDPSVAAQTPLDLSSTGVVDASPAATVGLLTSAPAAGIAAVVAAPLQGQPLISQSTAAAVLPATLPSAQPAASPSLVAGKAFWTSYSQAASAAVHAAATAGGWAWWGSSLQSSNAADSTGEGDPRIAVLDALLAQYGSP